MTKVDFWFKAVRIALFIGIVVSAVYTALDYLYITEMTSSGVDPLESDWSPALAVSFVFVGLAFPVAGIYLLVATIGFVFRSAQWLKTQDSTAVRYKPGWAIAGYLLPIPVVSIVVPFLFQWDLNKGGAHSEKSKQQTKSLLIGTLVLGGISSAVLRSSLMDFSVLFGSTPEAKSIEEIINAEWLSFNGSLLDTVAMVLTLLAFKNIYDGLVKRSQAAG
jgi:hypothetical protein